METFGAMRLTNQCTIQTASPSPSSPSSSFRQSLQKRQCLQWFFERNVTPKSHFAQNPPSRSTFFTIYMSFFGTLRNPLGPLPPKSSETTVFPGGFGAKCDLEVAFRSKSTKPGRTATLLLHTDSNQEPKGTKGDKWGRIPFGSILSNLGSCLQKQYCCSIGFQCF